MDTVVDRVINLCPQLYSAGSYKELIVVTTQAITYMDSLSEETVSEIRQAHGMTRKPVYHKGNGKLHHPRLATMLDYRATIYEKTGEREKAIKDARRTIEVDPYSPKGYIRLVKLYKHLTLKRAEEVGNAGLRTLEHGVKKYKMQMNQRSIIILRNLVLELETLRKRKAEEEEQVKVQKKSKLIPIPAVTPQVQNTNQIDTRLLDIFVIFPFEVIELIFFYLSTTEALNLLSISRFWHDTIRNLRIFHKLKMRPQTSIQDLQACLQLVNGRQIQEMSLSSIRRPDEAKVLKLLLTNSDILINKSLYLNLIDFSLKKLVNQLSEGNNIVKLQRLVLSCPHDLNFEYKLLKQLPHLQSLSIITSGYSQSDILLPTIISPLFQSLHTLQIYAERKKSLPFQKLFEWDESIYPNLKVLVFKNCNFEIVNRINQHSNFLNKFPNLVQLSFENSEKYSFEQLFTNVNEFHNLRSFQLNELSCAKNNIFTNFLNNQQIFRNNIQLIFKNLVILNLSHSSIQFPALLKILQIATSLQKLNVGRCPNLYFKPGPFSQNTPHTFVFDDFVKYAFNLRTLSLDESLSFNDFAITQLIQAIEKWDGLKFLRNLNLSNNLDISGYKLLDLVKLRPLNALIINGIDIKPETIKMMENKKYVGKVECKIHIQGSYRI